MSVNHYLFRKTFVLLAFCSMMHSYFGQATSAKAVKNAAIPKSVGYDSLENFLGKDAKKYIGQELRVVGKTGDSYYRFFWDYTQPAAGNKTTIYKTADGYATPYDSLNGSFFQVLDVVLVPKKWEEEQEVVSDTTVFLKLREKKSNDIIYYEYWSQSHLNFPFLVAGYLEKSRVRYTSTEYVLRSIYWRSELYDPRTGKSVEIPAGSLWKCVDFVIEEAAYGLCLVLENAKGERVCYPAYDLAQNDYAFSKDAATRYEKQFGAKNWVKILKGEVKIGMTKEMCRVACGKPEFVKELNAGEEWTFQDRILKFKGDLVTEILVEELEIRTNDSGE